MRKTMFIFALLGITNLALAKEVAVCYRAYPFYGANDTITCGSTDTNIKNMYERGWQLKAMTSNVNSSGNYLYSFVFER